MPGEKSLQLNQYYGHGGNAFWKIMFSLFDEEFSADYEKRKAVLLKNNIALWDVLKACEREGSLDSAIVKEEVNDFKSFFAQHSQIECIAFNGQKAKAFFEKYVAVHTNIHSVVLPSTSPANAGRTFTQKLAEWSIVKKYVVME